LFAGWCLGTISCWKYAGYETHGAIRMKRFLKGVCKKLPYLGKVVRERDDLRAERERLARDRDDLMIQRETLRAQLNRARAAATDVSLLTDQADDDTPRALLPQVPLSEVISPAQLNTPLTIHEPAIVYGNVLFADLVAIIKLIQSFDPKTLFEIGTFDGRTTLNMAYTSSPDAKVYTLDLPKTMARSVKLRLEPSDLPEIMKDNIGVRYVGKACQSKITQLYGDSAAFDFTPFRGTIDFVFVDGSHSYEYVMNDIQQALKLLRHGRGVIVCHDYPYGTGVRRALHELYSAGGMFAEFRHIAGTNLACLILE